LAAAVSSALRKNMKWLTCPLTARHRLGILLGGTCAIADEVIDAVGPG
jgi:hypothetical protein